MRNVRRDAHPIPGPQSTCLNPLGGINVCCFGFYGKDSDEFSGIESQPLIFIMMMPSYQMLAFDHAYISQWYSKGSG